MECSDLAEWFHAAQKCKKKAAGLRLLRLWYHRDSNLGHTDFQSVALPTELWYLLSERKHTQQFDFARVLGATFWTLWGCVKTARKRQDHTEPDLCWSDYIGIWSARRLDSRKFNDRRHWDFIQRKSPRMLKGVVALCNPSMGGHKLPRELVYKSLVLHGLWLLFYAVEVSSDASTC